VCLGGRQEVVELHNEHERVVAGADKVRAGDGELGAGSWEQSRAGEAEKSRGREGPGAPPGDPSYPVGRQLPPPFPSRRLGRAPYEIGRRQ
jgi:hypothetical protein